MTRINCIPVEELTGPHLVAEYRELPRVFNLARKAAEKGTIKPKDTYTLGTGHVTFFYTRLTYLANRHKALVAEMIKRGYHPTFTEDLAVAHADIPSLCWHDWIPTAAAQKINRERIELRLHEAELKQKKA